MGELHPGFISGRVLTIPRRFIARYRFQSDTYLSPRSLITYLSSLVCVFIVLL